MQSMITPTVEIPTAGDYRVDRRECTVAFTTRHMFGLGVVRGTFRLRDGHIHVADPVRGSSARATISAGSFSTGVSARDVTVRSARYLDADNHPDITFASTRLERVEGRWVLHGSVTVRGRTQPVEVRIDDLRQDGSVLRLRAAARVDRYGFGVTAMKGLIGRRMTMHLDIVAQRGNG